MSDPLSTAASLMTVLSTCLTLADKLSSLRSARSDLASLCSDLTDLGAVLQTLKTQLDHVIRADLAHDHLPATLLANIDPALDACMRALHAAGKVAARLRGEIGSRAAGRLRWLWGAREVEAVRAQLAERRVTLSLALVATSCILNYNIACSTRKIERELTDLTDALAADAAPASTRNTVGSDVSNVLMRRLVWSTISSSSSEEEEAAGWLSDSDRVNRWSSRRASVAAADPPHDGHTADMDGFKRWSRRASVPASLKRLRRRTWDSVGHGAAEEAGSEAAAAAPMLPTKNPRRFGVVPRRSLQSILDEKQGGGARVAEEEEAPLPPPYSPAAPTVAVGETAVTSSTIVSHTHQPVIQACSIARHDDDDAAALPSPLEVFSPDACESGRFASMLELQGKRAVRWSLVIGRLPDDSAAGEAVVGVSTKNGNDCTI